MRLAVVVLGLCCGVLGCVQSDSVSCEFGYCPSGLACDTTHQFCVEPDQLTACAGQPDDTACTFAMGKSGWCEGGVCLVPECGDGVPEHGEACDDSNTNDTDGCSANCKSTERCGNGLVDLSVGEVCDDSNNADHDGCSSTCQPETPRWVDLSAGPPARYQHAMFYDAARDVIVMFGGRNSSSDAFIDTWEWRGTWTQPPPVVAPAAMGFFAGAYDADLGKVVLQGGLRASGLVGDSVAWDGAKWKIGRASCRE